VPERIEALEQALHLLDFDSIASLAHALKGAGGTAGFQCLTDVSARLERSAHEKEPRRIGDMLNQLRALNERIVI
jgi:HPt (histidine-containing phosphotransfer) domain-containing protein